MGACSYWAISSYFWKLSSGLTGREVVSCFQRLLSIVLGKVEPAQSQHGHQGLMITFVKNQKDGSLFTSERWQPLRTNFVMNQKRRYCWAGLVIQARAFSRSDQSIRNLVWNKRLLVIPLQLLDFLEPVHLTFMRVFLAFIFEGHWKT